MPVFMDLVSGYWLFEEVAEDRSHGTWHAPDQGGRRRWESGCSTCQ